MSVWVSLGRRLLRSICEEIAFRESFSTRLFAKNWNILPEWIPFRIIWILCQVAEMIAGTNCDRLKRYGRFCLTHFSNPIMKLPHDDLIKRQFELAGNSPAAWFMSAERLLAGARVLIRELRPLSMGAIGSPVSQEEMLLSPAFLLYGFAVENLLKALWLRRGNQFVVGGKFSGPKGVSGHDLSKLAALVNFDTTDEEFFVLSGLHVKLVAAARYPIGTDWYKQRPLRLLNGGFSSHTTFNSGDISLIESMVARLIKDLGYDG